ncbi:macrophage mannose receptor 1-like [Mya arenaria]|uniref:macrophage mannose receptor 1-like n=1 Tax=Mya arenaria TaxID=6604 RepID=UPI0022DED028|nr:macrophage mannose receptor 1-like [Mya arenaria]
MYTLLTVVYCVAFWALVTGDYDCICNYNVEATIHSSPAEGQPIGYMYEFDCKPLISIGKPPGWGLVAFEHKAGYLAIDANIDVLMCPGSPSDGDVVYRIDLCPYKFLSEVHANIQNKVFRQYMRYCYELRLKTGTWPDASKDCSERGGMLVVITDPHVQSLVHALVNNLQPPADIWLGFSDRDEEGVWRWVDGQPTSYTNWTPIDPVYNDIKDCAIMSHDSGSWMQAECSFYMLHTERLSWVCQYGI